MASWVRADFDTFGADEPVAPLNTRGALLSALREFDALRPPWHHQAACRDADGVDFFPGRGESVAPAKAVCRSCPMMEACLDYALEERIDHGIWGATAPRERARLRRRAA